MSHNILIIAAHSDDEVLGCGGTIAKLTSLGHNVATLFMTDGVSSRDDQNQKNLILERKLNSEAAAIVLGVTELKQLDFPDNGMDTVPLLEITQAIEEAINLFEPDTIFTHFLNDLNIDHSTVARATVTATRPLEGSLVKKVFGYEVNSSTEWAFGHPQFSPHYFVNITETFEKKTLAMRAYENELRTCPHPRSIEGITALASLRGNASGYEYAEAFEIYRLMED